MKKLSALLAGVTLIISGQCFAGTLQKPDDINLFDLGIGPSTQDACGGSSDSFGCGKEPF